MCYSHCIVTVVCSWFILDLNIFVCVQVVPGIFQAILAPGTDYRRCCDMLNCCAHCEFHSAFHAPINQSYISRIQICSNYNMLKLWCSSLIHSSFTGIERIELFYANYLSSQFAPWIYLDLQLQSVFRQDRLGLSEIVAKFEAGSGYVMRLDADCPTSGISQLCCLQIPLTICSSLFESF